MQIVPTKVVWMDGKLVPWDQATIHVASHVIHYASSVFSGGRCYRRANGDPVGFRLYDHAKRLVDSCKLTLMADQLPYSVDDIYHAIIQTIEANGLVPCYIRPVIYRGYGELGVMSRNCPVNMFILIQDWGSYLGDRPARVMVSSRRRPRSDSMFMGAKTGANYQPGQYMKNLATMLGFDEAIALTEDGLVSEGSGENIFMVRDGVLYTPDLASSVLGGIMRDTVITLARDLGIEVREQRIPPEFLYTSDEVFFTGSAAEITPIGLVDTTPIDQTPGNITTLIRRSLFGIINGPDVEGQPGWMTRHGGWLTSLNLATE